MSSSRCGPAKIGHHIRLDHLDCSVDVSIEFVQVLSVYSEFLVSREADDLNGVPPNEWIGDPKACDETRVFPGRILCVPIPSDGASVLDVQDWIEDGLMRQSRRNPRKAWSTMRRSSAQPVGR